MKENLVNYLLREYGKLAGDKNKIILSGSPRGGTSWLAELISQATRYALIWEPLEYTSNASYLERYGFGLERDCFIDPNKPNTTSNLREKKRYFQDLLDGKLLSLDLLHSKGTTNFINTVIPSLTPIRGYVIKFIRANRLLGWMVNEFDVKSMFILRHPCAVISSQLNFAWKEVYWGSRWKEFTQNNLKEKVYYSRLMKLFDTVSYPEEILALDWIFTTLLPLRGLNDNRILVISYEEILNDPSSSLSKVMSFFSVKDFRFNSNMVTRPSSTYKKSERDPIQSFRVDGWKNRLETDQIKRIMDICNLFELDFYNDDPEPNLDIIDKYGCLTPRKL